MSIYVNKGTLASTVVVSMIPDYSGNFICDGTDDDVQLQAAIDHVEALGGGMILTKHGTYDIGTPLDIDDLYLSFRGVGKATILKAQDDLDDNIIEMSGTAKWFQEIRDLQIDGNKANMSSGNGIWISHVYGTTDANMLLQNLWIQDVEDDGIYIVDGTGTREPHIINVTVTDAGNTSFRIGGTDHKLLHCVSENPQLHGFYLPGPGSLVQCKAFGSGKSGAGNGFYLTGIQNGQITLTNCWAQDCDGIGFLIYNTDKAQLVGCIADSNDDEGIKIDAAGEAGSIENIVDGCQSFDRAGGLFGQSHGIRLMGNTSDNIISSSNGRGVVGISDVGVNNRVHLCYNNGVWIP